MSKSRLILLVVVGIAAALLSTAWFSRNRKPEAAVIFQPLGRITGLNGGPQQTFAVSNVTCSTVEYALGRYKTFPGPDGQTFSNLESRAYARLAPWSGTQLALTLPSDGGRWKATLHYREVIGQAELNARGTLAYRFHLIGTNHVFPVWQTMTSEEFEK